MWTDLATKRQPSINSFTTRELTNQAVISPLHQEVPWQSHTPMGGIPWRRIHMWLSAWASSRITWKLMLLVPWSWFESESEVAQSCPTLCDPWTVVHQTPLSMGFSRQEYWSGLPFPSAGDLPNPGIKPRSPTMQTDALTSAPPGKHKAPYINHHSREIPPFL